MAKKETESTQAHVGRIGEIIFGNYMTSQGKLVNHATNPYDPKKDMVIDGKVYEVKTQVPFVTENAFTIREHQLKKCREADYVVFVSIPNCERHHWSSGRVYMVEGSKMKTRTRKMRDGRKMILIGIDQLQELFIVPDDDCQTLMKYSVSRWNPA